LPEHAARTLRPEDQISHYRIVGPLGAGGMGEVYRAQDQSLERSVALKILPPDLVRSEERVRRFVQEAKSASSLSHPNIVTIYEIGQDCVRSAGEPDSGPVHFISMELVGGKTLGTLIHEDKTDLRTLLGYLAQAAEGLAKAHAAGIVHRDLKPGNIMVTADGFAKVLDFGLAKLTEKREAGVEISSAPTMGADLSREGMVVGTAAYMAPEQVQGKSVDHRVDIFSFGCVLYEATTRRRPFAADSAIETMHKILHDKPAPVEDLNPRAPAELRRVIRRCLARNPDQRLQSMKDLAIELREIVDEYESLSAAASSGSGVSSTAAAARAPRANLALWLGAALAALGGISFVSLRRQAPQSQPFQSMRLSAQTSRGDVLDAALSPDGRFLAYLAVRAGGQPTLRVRQVATGSDVEAVPAGNAQIGNPSFSPDGNYVFYTASKPETPNYRSLFQVPALGGTPRERAFDVDSRPSFSPDGKQAVFVRGFMQSAESRLIVVDLESGKERVLASVANQELINGAPSWSRDGKTIAAIVFRNAPNLESTIALFDAQSGARRDLTKLPRTTMNSLAWLRDGTGLVSTASDLNALPVNQVLLHTYPDARKARVTNDFATYRNVSASAADDTIAAVRNIRTSNLWLADAAGAPARRLTSIANPENSPFGVAPVGAETVVYAAAEDRHAQLFAIDLARAETRRLTSGSSHSISPRGGKDFVFFDRLDDSGVHVWRIGLDGSGARSLTSGAGEQTLNVASPDGLHVLFFHYDTPRKLSVLAHDGRIVLSVTDALGNMGFSPDSKSVAISFAGKDAQGLSKPVWRVWPLAGGGPTTTILLPGQAFGLRWAPDGRGVTYVNTADPARNIYRQAFAGGPAVPVTRFSGEGRITGHTWSPDGRKLAVRIQSGDTSNLWVTEADGSRPVQVTQLTAEVFNFDWLADSRRLVVNAGTSAWDAVLIRDFR
jgi:serine/threonine protein kinase/Tol biopolymer transport system component